VSLKELGFSLVGFDPVAMQKKAVNLIGEDQLLEWHTLLAEGSRERHGLREGNVGDRRRPESAGLASAT